MSQSVLHNEFRNEDFRLTLVEIGDGFRPYELGIAHFQFNGGKVIVVGAYDSLSEARDDFYDLQERMIVNPPDRLFAVGNDPISELDRVLNNKDPEVYARNFDAR